MVYAATMMELPILIQMALTMHQESRYRTHSVSEDKIREFFIELLESPNGILLMTDHGFFAGIVGTEWFGEDICAVDKLLYVDKPHRGGRDATRLVLAYIEKAKLLGAQEICLSDTTEIAVDRNEKFFTGLGFRRVGGNYLLEA